MPSTQFFFQSGGIPLVSGDPYSGTPFPIGGVQVRLQKAASAPIYVGWSGTPTVGSGGVFSSGGMADGQQLTPGDGLFIQKAVLYNLSGKPRIDAVKLVGPATASGVVVDWFVT